MIAMFAENGFCVTTASHGVKEDDMKFAGDDHG
jgi:hypothetical protein